MVVVAAREAVVAAATPARASARARAALVGTVRRSRARGEDVIFFLLVSANGSERRLIESTNIDTDLDARTGGRMSQTHLTRNHRFRGMSLKLFCANGR